MENLDPKKETILNLIKTDETIARSVEDLIDLLISKGLVTLDEFPEAIRMVYNYKKELRKQL